MEKQKDRQFIIPYIVLIEFSKNRFRLSFVIIKQKEEKQQQHKAVYLNIDPTNIHNIPL